MRLMPNDAFDKFSAQRKKDLQRIARATRGECQLADVTNEAWIMARTLPAPGGGELDLNCAGHQEMLLSHLYQHLVRYTEQNVRRAVRLDYSPANSSQADDVHPLTYLLAGDDGCNPLNALLDHEEALEREASLCAHGSLAGAYVHLLRHFDNKMCAVADHLLISPSHAYRRCAQARLLAASLKHIAVPVTNQGFIPGPWRSFQLRRCPVQLAFDFDEELPFPSSPR